MRTSRDAQPLAVGILAYVAFLILPVGGSAQEQVPGAPACELPPVTLPLFDATPAAVIASTPVSSVADDAGAAPTDAVVMRMAIESIVACINMGDPALQYAVFTDRYLAEQLADPSSTYQPAFEQQLDVATDPDRPQFSIDSVEEVTPLDDGRVSVVVTLSTNGTRYEDRLVLANVGGDWLIDDVELIDPATPGARARTGTRISRPEPAGRGDMTLQSGER